MICPVDTCGRSMPAVAAICGACQADLRRALAAVPDVARNLDVNLSGQHTRHGGGRTEIEDDPTPAVLRIGSLGFGLRASDTTIALHNTLYAWVAALHEDTWPADTPAAMAAWLQERLSRLANHQAAPQAHQEITGAVQDAWRAVDRPADRQFAGRCTCGAALYTKPGASTVQCRDCDAEPVQVASQLDQLRARVRDQLAHAYGVAALLARLDIKAPESTIRRWAKQGRLISHGTDKRGRRLYRVGDVLDIAINDIQRGPTRLRTTQRGA